MDGTCELTRSHRRFLHVPLYAGDRIATVRERQEDREMQEILKSEKTLECRGRNVRSPLFAF